MVPEGWDCIPPCSSPSSPQDRTELVMSATGEPMIPFSSPGKTWRKSLGTAVSELSPSPVFTVCAQPPGRAVLSRDVTQGSGSGCSRGMSASLFQAGSDLAKFLQRLPGGQAGATRANSSTDGKGHAQARLLQGPREGGGLLTSLIL